MRKIIGQRSSKASSKVLSLKSISRTEYDEYVFRNIIISWKNSAAGHDDICATILKEVVDGCIEQLNHLINKSMHIYFNILFRTVYNRIFHLINAKGLIDKYQY